MGRASLSTGDLYRELEETRELLDRGLPSAAESRLRHIINNARRDVRVLAHSRRWLSVALVVLGCYRESLEAVQKYEAPHGRGELGAENFAGL